MATGCKYSDIMVSPQELKFEMQEGAQFVPPYQKVCLEKMSHDLTSNWFAVADTAWVYHRPRSGKAPAHIQVGTTTTPRTWAPGTYTARLLLSSREGVAILPSPYIAITLEIKGKESGPGEPTEPTEPEPPPEPPAEPPVEPPTEEPWWVRLWKWLVGLFWGK